MQKRFKKIISVLVIVAIPLAPINTHSFISNHSWKSSSQNRIVDWMDFDESYLKLDGRIVKLSKTEEKKGIILLSLHKYLIALNNEGKLCLYTNKGK